jgi:hypothetical protein
VAMLKSNQPEWPADDNYPKGRYYGPFFVRQAWHCSGRYTCECKIFAFNQFVLIFSLPVIVRPMVMVVAMAVDSVSNPSYRGTIMSTSTRPRSCFIPSS